MKTKILSLLSVALLLSIATTYNTTHAMSKKATCIIAIDAPEQEYENNICNAVKTFVADNLSKKLEITEEDSEERAQLLFYLIGHPNSPDAIINKEKLERLQARVDCFVVISAYKAKYIRETLAEKWTSRYLRFLEKDQHILLLLNPFKKAEVGKILPDTEDSDEYITNTKSLAKLRKHVAKHTPRVNKDKSLLKLSDVIIHTD